MSGPIRWRPPPNVRKTHLLLRIAASGAWPGTDLVLGALTVTVLGAGPTGAAAATTSPAAFTTGPRLAMGL